MQPYREMPCYSNLMHIQCSQEKWDEDEKRSLSDEYQQLLSDDDDRLTGPVGYRLVRGCGNSR